MAGRYVSHYNSYRRDFEAQIQKRTRAASIYLAGQVKADVSQPGTLRYNPTTKSGKTSRSFKTVYNFTHSRPGNPPYKQSGNLRQSIAWEVIGLVGRVGSGIKRPRYPLYLELGTRRMAARPYLRTNLLKHRDSIRRILTNQIPSGGLPPVKSFQFRSGHFGKGAGSAGWG